MAFFQNPFAKEFDGVWVLGDRQHSPTFRLPANAGRGDDIVAAWTKGPYDMSGNDVDGNVRNILKISFALKGGKNWATFSINVATGAASASAVTAREIIANLNADASFAERFTASIQEFPGGGDRVAIKQKASTVDLKFYIVNGQAEEAMRFNARAGVAELPGFFGRHTIANRFTYTDGQNAIIQLDPSANDVDADIIDAAVDAYGTSLGFDSGDVSADWELLKGRSGLFVFQKITVDGSNRITQIIEYHAGAVAGDFARKITYSYTSSNTNPDKKVEIPYTLTGSDLVTP